MANIGVASAAAVRAIQSILDKYMMGMRPAIAVLLSCTLATLLNAQDGDRRTMERPFDVFERASRFMAAWPTNYLFEGQPTLAVYLRSHSIPVQELRDLGRGSHKAGCVLEHVPMFGLAGAVSAYACTHAFTPRFVVRQMSDSSAAVKPPSFNPYYEWATYQMSLDDVGGNRGSMAYWRLRVAHYSNGQAGCTYEGDVWKGKDIPCERPDSVKQDALNTDDGDFSTSYVEMGYGIGRYSLADNSAIGGFLIGEASFIQHATYANILKRLPGSMGAEQKRTYGIREYSGELRGLVRVDSAGRLGAVALQGRASVTYAPLRAKGFLNYQSEISAGVSFERFFGLGAFIRRAWGYDYYNLGYGRRVDPRGAFMLQFDRGLSSKPFRFGA